MTVGLLPAYGRGIDDNVFAVGGMTADWNAKIKLTWTAINSDAMRPAKTKEVGAGTPNLPRVDSRYAKFAEHVDDFVAGFEAYAKFLSRTGRDPAQGGLFDGFAGLPVRKVIRPTRFYYMLLQRLKNHREMSDGIAWSAQADFVARLADWEKESDPLWPLAARRARGAACVERAAFRHARRRRRGARPEPALRSALPPSPALPARAPASQASTRRRSPGRSPSSGRT